MVADVNVLIAAFRADHPHHPAARSWLDRATGGREPLAIPDLVWVGFVRIVTNTHVFEVPSSPSEAFGFVDAIAATPPYVGLPGFSEGLRPFSDLSVESDAWGNLIPDAYIAAIALAHGASVVSFDRDFRRFDGLSIVVPT